MIRYLMDTDHLTLHEHGHAVLRHRLGAAPPGSVALSLVTVEESLRGRLGVLSRRLDEVGRLHGYAKLLESLQFFQAVPVVPWCPDCESHFQALLGQKLRVGSRDLKIAATALAHKLTVLTRNRSDFGKVTGLALEDWSALLPGAPTP